MQLNWRSRWPEWGNRDTRANEEAGPYENSIIRQIHMVLVVWSNLCDFTVSVQEFGSGVLDYNIGANINLTQEKVLNFLLQVRSRIGHI